jgi:hypothetical protein
MTSKKQRRNAPLRKFPTESEVDVWIHSHYVDSTQRLTELVGVSQADQQIASTNEARSILRRTSAHLVDDDPDSYSRDLEPGTDAYMRGLRAGVRRYLAAASVGIKPLCEHTRDNRPLFLSCDPPAISCAACWSLPKLQAIGFLFDNKCDECGRYSKRLSDSTVNLGNVMIFAHVCNDCKERALGKDA